MMCSTDRLAAIEKFISSRLCGSFLHAIGFISLIVAPTIPDSIATRIISLLLVIFIWLAAYSGVWNLKQISKIKQLESKPSLSRQLMWDGEANPVCPGCYDSHKKIIHLHDGGKLQQETEREHYRCHECGTRYIAESKDGIFKRVRDPRKKMKGSTTWR